MEPFGLTKREMTQWRARVRARPVIKAYLEGATLKEAGIYAGVGPERARQMIKKFSKEMLLKGFWSPDRRIWFYSFFIHDYKDMRKSEHKERLLLFLGDY